MTKLDLMESVELVVVGELVVEQKQELWVQVLVALVPLSVVVVAVVVAAAAVVVPCQRYTR